jgi:hypothetical protein
LSAASERFCLADQHCRVREKRPVFCQPPEGRCHWAALTRKLIVEICTKILAAHQLFFQFGTMRIGYPEAV